MRLKRQSSDPAHEETDKLLAELEKKISKEYAQAQVETKRKLDDYMRRFKVKDSIKAKQVKDGKLSYDEYIEWRKNQLLVGQRWEEMLDTLSEDMLTTNAKARSMAYGYTAEAYATNYNYGIYESESLSGYHVDTAFTLYDRETVERMMRDDPDMLPPPGRKLSEKIAKGKAERWEKSKLQSLMTQGVLQGESIPHLADRVAREMGETNRKAAIRNARTMVTGAQNAGRRQSHERAYESGIKLDDVWIATLDSRTRHEHRVLDGQAAKPGKPFVVDGETIRFPGDPLAAPYLVYNCRCTIIGTLSELPNDVPEIRKNADIKGMTYDEWKNYYNKKKSN